MYFSEHLAFSRMWSTIKSMREYGNKLFHCSTARCLAEKLSAERLSVSVLSSPLHAVINLSGSGVCHRGSLNALLLYFATIFSKRMICNGNFPIERKSTNPASLPIFLLIWFLPFSLIQGVKISITSLMLYISDFRLLASHVQRLTAILTKFQIVWVCLTYWELAVLG